MTVIVLRSGSRVETPAPYEEVLSVWQTAWANELLVELTSPDTAISPWAIDFIVDERNA